MTIMPWSASSDVKPYYPTVVDFETNSEGECIGVGFAYSYTNTKLMYESFFNLDQWWGFYCATLEFHKTRGYDTSRLRRIYAHNGANFDWLLLIEYLRTRYAIHNLRYIMADSTGIGVDIQLPEIGTIELRDSYRLLPSSYAALSASFGIEQGKIDLQGKLPEQVLKENPDLYWEYVKHDVVGLQEIIYQFWKMIYDIEGSIGELPLTLASLAMRLWRKGLTKPIPVPTLPELKWLERKAYRGGRTECYTTGVVNDIVYDINSQYPYVMLTGEYPLSYIGAWTDKIDGMGVYEVEFEQTNRTIKPILYDYTTGKYAYEGYGYFYFPELEWFSRFGGKLWVRRGYRYSVIGNPFVSFINKWWNIRSVAEHEGREGLRYVAKILMNSLYGKLGQKELRWSMVSWDVKKQVAFQGNGGNLIDFGDIQMIEEEVHSDTTFVGIAGTVTSYARVLLHKYMSETIANGGIVHYVDTDSLHVSGVSFKSNKDIGGLKKEYEGETAYAGKKLYFHRGHDAPVMKGIGTSARKQMTYDTFVEIANGERIVETESVAFPSVREVMLQGKKASKPFVRRRRIRRTTDST